MKVVRVYNNGDKMVFTGAAAEYEIDQSTRARPGVALIKDGKCIQKGYLDDERIAKLEQEFTEQQ